MFAGRPNDAWGLGADDRVYGATLNALVVDAGDGSDRIFGGPMDDTIRGGAGDDYLAGGRGNDSILAGGRGNDSILGGTGNDLIVGDTGTPPDRYEAVTRGGTTSVNDEFSFASLVAAVDAQPGMTIEGLTLHEGDAGDWYILPTPNARQFGGAGRSALSIDMLSAMTEGGATLPLALFAAADTDPTAGLSVVPVEQFEGVPEFYAVHVTNPDPNAAAQGGYSLTISATAADSTDVASGEAGPAIVTSDAAFRPVFIPLGDINVDGFDDFIGAVNDDRGNVVDVIANPNAPIPPTFAHVYFGAADASAITAPAFTLELPAPVREWSLVGSRSYFLSPGDYNGDGRSDLAVMVQDEISPFETSNFSRNIQGKLYIVEGAATVGQSGALHIVNDATFTQTYAHVAREQPAANVGDVTGDGIDDLLVISPPSGTITGPPPVRTALWAGVAGTPLALEESVRITGSDDTFFGTNALVAAGGIGDFSGDGTNDFAIVERSGIGTNIYLVYGGAALAPTGSVQTISNSAAAADATLTEATAVAVVEAIHSVGDVNDDGRDDFAIASSLGTLLVPGQGVIAGTNSLAWLGNVVSIGGGVDGAHDTLLFAAGDVNGDGADDLGAATVEMSGRLVDDGSVLGHLVGRVYLGGSAAFDAWVAEGLTAPSLVIEPGRALYSDPRGATPLAFAAAGDINGDGRSDLGFGELLGNVTNVYLGVNGLGAPAAVLPVTFGDSDPYAFEIGTPIDPANATAAAAGLNLGGSDALDVSSAFALEGTIAGDHLSQPSNIGDLNRDGYQDFVVRGDEFSYLLLGPVELDGVENVSQFSELTLIHSNLGKFNSRPGDVNGDGYDDLAFADPFAVTAHTEVTVFYGRPDLPKVLDAVALGSYVENVDFVRLNADLSPQIELSIDMLYFNADDLADVVITGTSGNYWTSNVISGQNFIDNQDPGFGLLFVQRDPTDEMAVASALFGDALVGALQIERDRTSLAQVVGDVSGDGLEDLLISVPGFMRIGNSQFDIPDVGRSYLFLGRPDIVGTYPNNLVDLAQADEIWQDYSLGGGSIALGDLDLDGYDEFAIARTREGVLADGSLLVFRGSPDFGSTSFHFDAPMSQAEILAANAGSEFFTDVGGSMEASGGRLRLNGTTAGTNEQIFYIARQRRDGRAIRVPHAARLEPRRRHLQRRRSLGRE